MTWAGTDEALVALPLRLSTKLQSVPCRLQRCEWGTCISDNRSRTFHPTALGLTLQGGSSPPVHFICQRTDRGHHQARLRAENEASTKRRTLALRHRMHALQRVISVQQAVRCDGRDGSPAPAHARQFRLDAESRRRARGLVGRHGAAARTRVGFHACQRSWATSAVLEVLGRGRGARGANMGPTGGSRGSKLPPAADRQAGIRLPKTVVPVFDNGLESAVKGCLTPRQRLRKSPGSRRFH